MNVKSPAAAIVGIAALLSTASIRAGVVFKAKGQEPG